MQVTAAIGVNMLAIGLLGFIFVMSPSAISHKKALILIVIGLVLIIIGDRRKRKQIFGKNKDKI